MDLCILYMYILKIANILLKIRHAEEKVCGIGVVTTKRLTPSVIQHFLHGQAIVAFCF